DQRLAVLEGILGCILILLYTVPFYQKGASAALHSLAFHGGVRRSCALHLHLSGEWFSIFDFSDTPWSCGMLGARRRVSPARPARLPDAVFWRCRPPSWGRPSPPRWPGGPARWPGPRRARPG